MLALTAAPAKHVRLMGHSWGGEDLMADLGALAKGPLPGVYDDTFKLARTINLMASVAAGVTAYDTVYPDIKNIEGLRFMRRTADGVKMVAKLKRNWYGLDVTYYIQHEQASVREAWVQRVAQRASELNYLRGEAFTLGGEFLDRGDLDWTAMFLDPAKEAVLRRTVDRLNESGGDTESRVARNFGMVNPELFKGFTILLKYSIFYSSCQ